MTDADKVAAMTAALVAIEEARIEGCLRTIRDLAGPQAVMTSANDAAKRVIRANLNDSDGWVA